MLPWNPNQWTEEYLLSLIGESETINLEFKSGKALDEKKDNNKENFIKKQLSPTVSAFANSEGGILIIGMTEVKKDKQRVAAGLDGIMIDKENAIQSFEQLQQIIEDSISPYLLGLKIRKVPLSGALQGRYAVVIHVP